jgi:hypothetical protein
MAERTWVLLRRLRVPRVRRRHEGHHYAQPAAHLWSTAALCVSLALTFPVMMRPIHGIVEARLLAPGGWLRSKLAPSQWRRRRRPRSRGAVGGRVLRAGVRGVRVLRREHGPRDALLRAARALPPPRRGTRASALGGLSCAAVLS